MKKAIFLLSFLTVSAITVAFAAYRYNVKAHHATCTGSRSCNACKNCKYCKHCAKDGGSCGVCK